MNEKEKKKNEEDKRMREREREKKYEESVFYGIGAGDTRKIKRERRKDALGRAHEIRKFEIELYWKRALYFWGFEVVLVGALAAVVSSGERDVVSLSLAVALSVMGFFISIAWCFMSKGGKAWQENWERHIDFLEDDYEGRLHKTVIGNKKKFYSVSRINQDVIKVWGFFWFVAFWSSLAILGSLFCPRWCLCSDFLYVFSLLGGMVLLFVFSWHVRPCVVSWLDRRWKTKTDSWKSDDKYNIHTREKKLK